MVITRNCISCFRGMKIILLCMLYCTPLLLSLRMLVDPLLVVLSIQMWNHIGQDSCKTKCKCCIASPRTLT